MSSFAGFLHNISRKVPEICTKNGPIQMSEMVILAKARTSSFSAAALRALDWPNLYPGPPIRPQLLVALRTPRFRNYHMSENDYRFFKTSSTASYLMGDSIPT